MAVVALSTGTSARPEVASRASLRSSRRDAKLLHARNCGCTRCNVHSAACVCSSCSGRSRRSIVTKAIFGKKDDKAATLTTPKAATVTEVAKAAPSTGTSLSNEVKYMLNRINTVQESFPTALSLDDFIIRTEMALCSYGFTGDNSIAVANMCRDEITCGLKAKVEEVFPLVFNINGLGGGITAGVIGFGAGLSHSPLSVCGKRRYVFFSFPHIAITSKGVVGTVGRPNQDKPNSACGALIACLGQLKASGVESAILGDGVHVARDPEYSILKSRIAKRMIQEDVDPQKIDLVEITKIAERQISADLEYLISKSVNPELADYAIVTGVQIHNWADAFDDAEPNLEFVAPTRVSVIIDGKRTELDLSQMPAATPRVVRKLSGADQLDTTRDVAVYTGTSTVSSVRGSPMFDNTTERALRKDREDMFAKLLAKNAKQNFRIREDSPPTDDAVISA